MDYKQLKDQIDQVKGERRPALQRLLLYVSTGDAIHPDFAPYLDGAQTYKQFFDAVYADETRRFTTVWADWARLSCKKWLDCFEPVVKIENIRLKGDGLPVEFGTGIVLAPTGSRDNICNFYVFESGAFNTAAATFVTSLGGRFSCAGYDFTGIYGVYRHKGNVILEAWDEECAPQPTADPSKRI